MPKEPSRCTKISQDLLRLTHLGVSAHSNDKILPTIRKWAFACIISCVGVLLIIVRSTWRCRPSPLPKGGYTTSAFPEANWDIGLLPARRRGRGAEGPPLRAVGGTCRVAAATGARAASPPPRCCGRQRLRHHVPRSRTPATCGCVPWTIPSSQGVPVRPKLAPREPLPSYRVDL